MLDPNQLSAIPTPTAAGRPDRAPLWSDSPDMACRSCPLRSSVGRGCRGSWRSVTAPGSRERLRRGAPSHLLCVKSTWRSCFWATRRTAASAACCPLTHTACPRSRTRAGRCTPWSTPGCCQRWREATRPCWSSSPWTRTCSPGRISSAGTRSCTGWPRGAGTRLCSKFCAMRKVRGSRWTWTCGAAAGSPRCTSPACTGSTWSSSCWSEPSGPTPMPWTTTGGGRGSICRETPRWRWRSCWGRGTTSTAAAVRETSTGTRTTTAAQRPRAHLETSWTEQRQVRWAPSAGLRGPAAGGSALWGRCCRRFHFLDTKAERSLQNSHWGQHVSERIILLFPVLLSTWSSVLFQSTAAHFALI